MSLVLGAPGWCVSKSCWVRRVNALLNNMAGISRYLEWLGRCIFIFSIMDQVKQWLFQPSEFRPEQSPTFYSHMGYSSVGLVKRDWSDTKIKTCKFQHFEDRRLLRVSGPGFVLPSILH
jgi:hypothetical protein